MVPIASHGFSLSATQESLKSQHMIIWWWGCCWLGSGRKKGWIIGVLWIDIVAESEARGLQDVCSYSCLRFLDDHGVIVEYYRTLG